MSTLMQDLRFALRTLRRHWTVTLAAVLSLALTIGGNAAVFSMVDAFLFRPLPYPEPERLVLFGERAEDAPAQSGPLGVSLPTWADLRERSRTLDGWAAVQFRTLSLRSGDRAEPVSAGVVTAGFFDVLGAGVAQGRSFLAEEGVEGARKVVVVSDELRQQRWGDADPLGAVISLGSEPHEVVGVLPPGFGFLTGGVEVWVPLTRSPYAAPRDQRDVFALARMAPGVTMEQVRAEARAVAGQLQAEHPAVQSEQTLDAYNLRHDLPTTQTRILFGLLQGVVLVALAIACVNITNLLLARGQDRTREIALRTVLGADRGRIVRQLLTESLVLCALGGAAGLAVGKAGTAAIVGSFGGLLPASFTPVLDLRVLAFTMAVTVVAGLLFGLAPALQTLRTDHAGTLREGQGRAGGGRSRHRLTRTLVVAEIALSMVALGVGSLLVRSFLEIRSGDPGFDASDVLVATLAVPRSRYPEDADQRRLAEAVLERVRDLPGVGGAALASTLPQGFGTATDSVRLPGEASPGDGAGWRALRIAASPGYLEALDIELLQGRFFEPADRDAAAPVAVVNRALAGRRFGGRSPVGERLVVGGVEREVVGVVADVQQQIMAAPGAPTEAVYLPQAQAPALANLVLEATGDPHDLAAPLRDALHLLDPDLALATVLTLEEYVDRAFVGIRVFNWVLGGFGAVALFLAALGTYGVLAYSVSQRAHEIGVRLALGARPRAVVGMISRQGLALGGVGLALGLLATLPLIGVLRSLVASFSTVEPATLVGVAAILAGVTGAASVVPALRAARVDPVVTLKGE